MKIILFPSQPPLPPSAYPLARRNNKMRYKFAKLLCLVLAASGACFYSVEWHAEKKLALPAATAAFKLVFIQEQNFSTCLLMLPTFSLNCYALLAQRLKSALTERSLFQFPFRHVNWLSSLGNLFVVFIFVWLPQLVMYIFDEKLGAMRIGL
jgi:hypothetical protein